MYFPFFRGKQFELIAIRELVQNNLISKDIIPIIEPIKLSSTFISTLNLFDEKEYKIGVVCNPSVGNLKGQTAEILEGIKDKLESEHIICSYILNQDVEREISSCIQYGIDKTNLLMIHQDSNFVDEYTRLFSNDVPKYNLIPEGTYKRKIKNNIVIFEDRFVKQKRNSDYTSNTDEFYSEDHLYYSEEGYIGFADYSIVGKEYLDGGFLPYAVTIHITYFSDEGSLRIKHFVSDSNTDTSDTASKFYEALKKMMEWQGNSGIDSYALRAFRSHYNDGSYPGLGTVKKLSLMHHLELMSSFLSRR